MGRPVPRGSGHHRGIVARHSWPFPGLAGFRGLTTAIGLVPCISSIHRYRVDRDRLATAEQGTVRTGASNRPAVGPASRKPVHDPGQSIGHVSSQTCRRPREAPTSGSALIYVFFVSFHYRRPTVDNQFAGGRCRGSDVGPVWIRFIPGVRPPRPVGWCVLSSCRGRELRSGIRRANRWRSGISSARDRPDDRRATRVPCRCRARVFRGRLDSQ